jgi:hypothetical protein
MHDDLIYDLFLYSLSGNEKVEPSTLLDVGGGIL